jgi:hypothetical protein
MLYSPFYRPFYHHEVVCHYIGCWLSSQPLPVATCVRFSFLASSLLIRVACCFYQISVSLVYWVWNSTRWSLQASFAGFDVASVCDLSRFSWILVVVFIRRCHLNGVRRVNPVIHRTQSFPAICWKLPDVKSIHMSNTYNLFVIMQI